MPIYSNNRTGSMVESTVKGYTCNDFGRIIYESQLNDMAFFEAALNCDFNEIKGLREGTLLEAEVKEENKKSFKAFLTRMGERIKAAFAKIIQAIGDFANRLASYALGTGVKFKENFNKTIKDTIGDINNWNGKIEDVKSIDTNEDILSFKLFDNTQVIRSYFLGDKRDNLKTYLLYNSKDAAEYNGKIKTLAKPKAFTKSDVAAALDTVSTARAEIKKVKQMQKDANNTAKTLVKEIEALKNAEGISVEMVNKACTDIESAFSIISRGKIAAIKYNTNSYRAALNLVLADIRKADKKNDKKSDVETQHNSAMLEFNYYMICANPINESNRAQVKALIESC